MDTIEIELRSDFHSETAQTTLSAMKSSRSGLPLQEAAKRYARHGANKLPQQERPGIVRRLLLQFHNLLIYVLVAAAIMSLLLGHVIDTIVIFGVVLINALIGLIQEGRAEQALEAIRSMIDPKAAVLRAGRRVTVPAEEIVPGDIVLLEAGDRVPADLRLIHARNLKIDEAILTGESVAVDKGVDPVAKQSALGDRSSLAFSGTFVAAGQGAGVAIGTGSDTELGRITGLLSSVEALKTPLIRQMDGFAWQLTLITLAISALTFIFAYLARGYSTDEAFMTVVGLTVAAIPEGLPAIMTITLAIGVRAMASRNAIIRRLPAVETLGSVSVICSDKTGTLTRNEMTVRALATAAGRYRIDGVGYEPTGALTMNGRDANPSEDRVLRDLIRAAVLCNDAEIRETEKGWIADGDPMEGALVTLAAKAGLEAGAVRADFRRRDEIPFDAQHRFMATLHDGEGDEAVIVIKGAPERILEMCVLERHTDGDRPLDASSWWREADRLAGKGQRVLGFAVKHAQAELSSLDFSDVDGEAVLLGFAGFIDPPREEARQAVAECQTAGIRVIMITGDHAITAQEIGRQLGLSECPRVLAGRDLDGMDDAGLADAVERTDVFARTTPEHKLRLVRALQSKGLVVAMTGDGVNDAPALKQADVGVAMGRKGTEVAKEASEMVLADDNFASIVAAVRQGRTVYDNIMKVIAWTLPTNGGEALTILAAIALGLTLPITPVQILWINMVTAVALGLTLAFESPEPGSMRRPPRRQDQPILSAEMIWRIAFVSFLFVAGAFGVYYWAKSKGLSVEEARTLVVNTIVVMEIFYLFSVRYVHGSSLTLEGVLGTPAVLMGVGIVIAAQLALTYLPFMNAIFQTRPVSAADGLVVIGVSIGMLIFVELEKLVRRGFTQQQ